MSSRASQREIDWIGTYSLSSSDGSNLNAHQGKKYIDLTLNDHQTDSTLANSMFRSMASQHIATSTIQLPFVPQDRLPSSTPSTTDRATSKPKLTDKYTTEMTTEDIILEYLFQNGPLTSEKVFIQLASYWYRGRFYTNPSSSHSNTPKSTFTLDSDSEDDDFLLALTANNSSQSTTSPILNTPFQSLPPAALINILSYMSFEDILALLPVSKIFILSALVLLLSPAYRLSLTTSQPLLFQSNPISQTAFSTHFQPNYKTIQNAISQTLTSLQAHFLVNLDVQTKQLPLTSAFQFSNDFDSDLTLDDLLSPSGTTSQPSFIASPHSTRQNAGSAAFLQNSSAGSISINSTLSPVEHAQGIIRSKNQYLEELLLEIDKQYRITINNFNEYSQNSIIQPHYYHTYPVYTPTDIHNAIQNQEMYNDVQNELPQVHSASTFDQALLHNLPALSLPSSPLSASPLAQQQAILDTLFEVAPSLDSPDQPSTPLSPTPQSTLHLEDNPQHGIEYIFKYSVFMHEKPQQNTPNLAPSSPSPVSSSPHMRGIGIHPGTPNQRPSSSSQSISSLKLPSAAVQSPQPQPPSPHLQPLAGTPQQFPTHIQEVKKNHNLDGALLSHDVFHKYPHLGHSWGRWSSKRGLIWSLLYLPDTILRIYNIATIGLAETKQLQLLHAAHHAAPLHGGRNPMYYEYLSEIYNCLNQPNLYDFITKEASPHTRLLFNRFLALLPSKSLYRDCIMNNTYDLYKSIIIPTYIEQIFHFEAVFRQLCWNPQKPLLFHVFLPTIGLTNIPKFISTDVSDSIMKDCNRTLINKACRCHYKDRKGLYWGTRKPWFTYYYRLHHLMTKSGQLMLPGGSSTSLIASNNTNNANSNISTNNINNMNNFDDAPIRPQYSSNTLYSYEENADITTQHSAYHFNTKNQDSNGSIQTVTSSTNLASPNSTDRTRSGSKQTIRQRVNGYRESFQTLSGRDAGSKDLSSPSRYTAGGISTGNMSSFEQKSGTGGGSDYDTSRPVASFNSTACEHCNDLSNSCLCVILHCLAYVYPDIGYCQGLNFVAAQILLQCDLPTAFQILIFMLRYNDSPTAFDPPYRNISQAPQKKIELVQLPQFVPVSYNQPIIITPKDQCVIVDDRNDTDSALGVESNIDPDEIGNYPKSPEIQYIKQPKRVHDINFPHYLYSTTEEFINIVSITNPSNPTRNPIRNPQMTSQDQSSGLNSQIDDKGRNNEAYFYIKAYHTPNPLQHRLFFASNLIGLRIARYTFIMLLKLYLPTLFFQFRTIQFPIDLLSDWFMTLFSSPSMHISPPQQIIKLNLGQALRSPTQQPPTSTSTSPAPPRSSRTPTIQPSLPIPSTPQLYEFQSPIAVLWDNFLLHGEIMLYRIILSLLTLATYEHHLDTATFDVIHQFNRTGITKYYLSSNETVRRRLCAFASLPQGFAYLTSSSATNTTSSSALIGLDMPLSTPLWDSQNLSLSQSQSQSQPQPNKSPLDSLLSISTASPQLNYSPTILSKSYYTLGRLVRNDFNTKWGISSDQNESTSYSREHHISDKFLSTIKINAIQHIQKYNMHLPLYDASPQ